MTLTQFSFYSRNHVDVDRWFLFRRRKKSVLKVCKLEGALNGQTRIKIRLTFQKSVWRLLNVESYVAVEVTRLLFFGDCFAKVEGHVTRKVPRNSTPGDTWDCPHSQRQPVFILASKTHYIRKVMQDYYLVFDITRKILFTKYTLL